MGMEDTITVFSALRTIGYFHLNANIKAHTLFGGYGNYIK
jgi:hypothetical protein